jgi:formylglycine-generating enzyme required for sulfatase activity
LESFFMVRHAVTQIQWQVVSELPKLNRDLNKAPGTHSPTDLWEAHAQPGMLPVDSISWYDCQEWIGRLNVWLVNNWRRLAGDRQGAFSPDYPPQLRLPSESQWEVACRAGTNTPFHYGDTIDAKWANFDAGCYTYGPGRNGSYRKRPGPVGFFGMVNRWGLSEMHGQHLDWCGDQWHPNPVGAGWPKDGMVWDGDDPVLDRIGSLQKHWRVLRGGSWFFFPSNCRSALRFSGLPDDVDPFPGVGLRPCCLLPPGP